MTAAEFSARSRTVIVGSVLLGLAARVIRLVGRWIAHVWTDLADDDHPAGPADHGRAVDRELDLLVDVVGTSRLVALAWWPVRRLALAWRASDAPRLLGETRRWLTARDDSQLLRLSGLTVAAAAVADAVVRLVDPRPASGFRALLWLAVLAAAVIAMTSPDSLLTAWRRRGARER